MTRDTPASSAQGSSTRAVHAGERTLEGEPLVPPIEVSSSFALGSIERAAALFRGEESGEIYARWSNASSRALEAKLAALEGAEDAVVTASGMAAISSALLASLESGDHFVLPRCSYAETQRLLRDELGRYAVTATFVDATSVDGYRAALQPNTKLFWLETPANPLLAVTDIRAVTELAQSHGIVTAVDNTFATPACQQPLSMGADLVVHSLTKALCGHGDALGGVVAGSSERIRRVRNVVRTFGGVMAPFNAFLVSRGIQTLALRQARACSSAMSLASWLASEGAVKSVYYPGLPEHPGHDVARQQMIGMGSLLAFELSGGADAARGFVERLELVTHAVSLGDCRTLITCPALTTAASMPPEARKLAGISDGLLRLSVGIEDVDDLRADLGRALSHIA
jgi:methionine-gamma-lyase